MFIPLGDDNSGRRTTPFIVWGLVALNAGMWFLQLTRGEAFTNGFAAIPWEIVHNADLVDTRWIEVHGDAIPLRHAPGPTPIWMTLFTAMFLHGSWMHIIGNMLYLWIFGDQIEDLLGHVRFLLFYLACGLAAAAAQFATDLGSIIPTLGASGAIAGVLGAYLVKFPSNRVHVLFLRFLIPLPAFVVLGFWIVLQLISQVGTPAGEVSGVAYMAHIGGFFAGLLLVFVLGGLRRPRQEAPRWAKRGRRGLWG